jgi:RNA polymerase sigma factor (sigma-70 family)
VSESENHLCEHTATGLLPDALRCTSMCLADPSDRDLIESCLRGEQTGWAQLLAKYERLIYSVARALCPDREDCSDVFQNVCLALYQNLDRLRSDQIVSAWLITVTRRQAYMMIRAKKPYVQIEENELVAQAKIDLIAEEFEMELAVARLDERCHRLIRSLYFDSKEPSYAEIAADLGMLVGSIGPTRARCLDKLKRLVSR